MRSGRILPAVALVLALAGCAGTSGTSAPDRPATTAATTTAPPSSAPPSSASPSSASPASAVALVGTGWHLAGSDAVTVRFDGLAITVADAAGSSSYAWTAQGADILVGQPTSSLAGAVPAPWLTRATRVGRTVTGLVLEDASGRPTARLTPDGTVAPRTATTLLTPATPGDGVVDAPASAIAGRWVLPSDLRTSVTFTDGTWRATSSCTSGTVGGTGAYRVLQGGLLLVTRTSTPIRGCPIIDGPRTAGPNAITAIARAASFTVDGRTLTLYDRSGTDLGSLTRA